MRGKGDALELAVLHLAQLSEGMCDEKKRGKKMKE